MCQWAEEQAPVMFQVAHTSVTPQALDHLVLQNLSPLHNSSSRDAYHIFIAFVVWFDLLQRIRIKLALLLKYTKFESSSLRAIIVCLIQQLKQKHQTD